MVPQHSTCPTLEVGLLLAWTTWAVLTLVAYLYQTLSVLLLVRKHTRCLVLKCLATDTIYKEATLLPHLLVLMPHCITVSLLTQAQQ
jgi:hypothetical protein